MEPIRVLHILHSMDRGGAENSIMNYYRNIDHCLVQFDFLLTTPNQCHFEAEIIAFGGKVFRVPLPKVLKLFPYIKAVSHFLQSHREYHIVHSHTSSKSFLPLMVAKVIGVPVRICHSHNTRTEKGWSGLIRNILKIPLKKVATHFFACGEEAARWLYGDSMVDSGRVLIMPNVIECNKFIYDRSLRENVRSQLKVSDNSLLLGCVARFSPQKNHRFLISVFYSFHKKYPDSVLVLIGDGELKGEIKHLIHAAGLDSSVLFLGVVPNVGDYLQAIDFFLMPSFYEGLPLSIIEAQISGLRCFASTGVPAEADKTGLVSFLPLDKGPYYWVDRISEAVGYVRTNHFKDLVDSGYDALTSAVWLQKFYQDVYNN